MADGLYTLQYMVGPITLRTLTNVQIYDESTAAGIPNEIAFGTATDAGTLTGAETIPMSRGAGLLQSTLTKIAQWAVQTYQGFTQQGTGAVSRPIEAKVLDYSVTPQDFGAAGNGVTDDTAAITAAVAYALSSGGAINWPTATYLITGSINNFHSVTHFGNGIIKRSIYTFYITPILDSQINTLYANPTGSDTNDGLTPDLPFATLQRACNVMQDANILPKLSAGTWNVSLSAGTFTEGGVWTKFAANANPVAFIGQVNGSNVPTTIIDGTTSVKTAGLFFQNGPALITVQNVLAQNFRANSVASGIVFANKGILQALTINVWSNNNLWAGINGDAIANFLVTGGTHTNNTNYGIRARGGVEISFGYNGSASSNRVSISGSGSAAIQVWDSSAGHCDFVDIANCPTGIWLVNNSRTTHTGLTFNTCNIGILAQKNSTFDYDVTTTFTSVADVYQMNGCSSNSTDAAGDMLTYDYANNRWATGVSQWGGSPFSATAHAWATNKTGTATFYYGVPAGTTLQMMWGTPAAPTQTYLQIGTTTPLYQWLMSGAVVLQYDQNSVNPNRDAVSSLGLAVARWSNVYAATATLTGPIALNKPSTVTAATYSQVAADSSLIFNGTAAQTVTLLNAATYPGRMLYVKNIAAFAVNSATSNVVPVGSATAGTAILAATVGKWAILQSDGTNWNVMASN